jgi:hypothetical protein
VQSKNGKCTSHGWPNRHKSRTPNACTTASSLPYDRAMVTCHSTGHTTMALDYGNRAAPKGADSLRFRITRFSGSRPEHPCFSHELSLLT